MKHLNLSSLLGGARATEPVQVLPESTSIADIGAYLRNGFDARPTMGASDDEGQPNYLSEQRHVAIALGAVAALRIDVQSDAALVREIERAVIKPRLRFAPMSPGRAPVRLSPDGVGILYVFRLVDSHPSQMDPSMWTSAEYRDSPFRVEFAGGSASFSAIGSVTASGYKWRSGLLGLGSPVDLRVVRRDDLPLYLGGRGRGTARRHVRFPIPRTARVVPCTRADRGGTPSAPRPPYRSVSPRQRRRSTTCTLSTRHALRRVTVSAGMRQRRPPG